MSALGLVPSGAPAPAAAPAAPPQLQLLLEDVLASRRRLWVRGRLRGHVSSDSPQVAGRHWWAPWRGQPNPPAPAPQVHLVTKISGLTLEADVPVQADGRFEALLEAELPVARRGWRVARNRVTFAGQSAEACAVVLTPPEPGAAHAVLLPPEFTYEPGGVQRLAKSEFAARLTRLLRDGKNGVGHGQPVYYLAAVPPDADNRQAELALAATALGWPAGVFVLLPAEEAGREGTLQLGVERLRWLFDGCREVRVLDPDIPTGEKGKREKGEKEKEDVRRCPSLFTPSPFRLFAPHRRPSRAARLPRYPVVFCHGMLACSMLKMSLPEDSNCFTPLREFLAGRGFRVLYPQVTPTGGVAERAAELREQIRRWTDEPVNLIAHSMGGLDARYLITHLGMADRVRSLTTVSTPHRGTYLAEWFRANFRNRVPLLLALEALGVNVDGFRDCLPERCAAFNDTTPDVPGVRYFSYGGSVPHSRVSPMLRRAWNLLLPIEGPNDGMVSMASARWGEYLGTVRADHFAQTPDGAFVRPGEDFDALGFYSRLVEDLAYRGF